MIKKLKLSVSVGILDSHHRTGCFRTAEAPATKCTGSASGFTVIDAVITLCLIGILIGVVIPRYQRLAVQAQEAALKTGLTAVRTSINLFRMLNNRNPNSLRELLETEVLLPARVGRDPYSSSFYKRNYLMDQAVDSRGAPLDPFGNPFQYDPLQGEVRSSTPGYESW